MAIHLGDKAPDFTADTTEGEISFHEWKGDSWVVFFGHPADFTPVCTTELGRTAGLKAKFDRRNTKVIALSVDPVEDHRAWAPDIGEVTGNALNFPIIADPDKHVAHLYDMRRPTRIPSRSTRGRRGQRAAGDPARSMQRESSRNTPHRATDRVE